MESSLSSDIEKVIENVTSAHYDSEYNKPIETITKSTRWEEEFRTYGYITIDGEKVEPVYCELDNLPKFREFERVQCVDQETYQTLLNREVENPSCWRYIVVLNKVLIRIHLQSGAINNDTPYYEIGDLLTEEDENEFLALVSNFAPVNFSEDENYKNVSIEDSMEVVNKKNMAWRLMDLLFNTVVLLIIIGVLVMVARSLM